MHNKPILYHASLQPVNTFRPFSHFAPYNQALSKMRTDLLSKGVPEYAAPVTQVFLYPVNLNITKPFVTKDVFDSRPHVIADVTAHVLQNKVSRLQESQKHKLRSLINERTTPKSERELGQVLQELGHDGLAHDSQNFYNIHENQVTVLGAPLHVPVSHLLEVNQTHLWEADARPKELGLAYFWILGRLVDISPYRNHKDWLLAHQKELDLDPTILEKPHKALWSAYQKHVIRLVWDPETLWKSGAGAQESAVLYINGFESDVWKNIAKIMNSEPWVGRVKTVVIEYVKSVNGKPNWYQTDIFKAGDLESLYRGRKPRRQLAPINAKYGGEPDLWEHNHIMNQVNDKPGAVIEMWHAHLLDPTFFHTHNHMPRNGFQQWPSHRQDIYLGMNLNGY